MGGCAGRNGKVEERYSEMRRHERKEEDACRLLNGPFPIRNMHPVGSHRNVVASMGGNSSSCLGLLCLLPSRPRVGSDARWAGAALL